MAGFGYKTAWLAVRDGDVDDTLTALGVRRVGPVGWSEGIDRAYRERDVIVATPRLPGAGGDPWVLVMGRWLAYQLDEIDAAQLSTVLGREVQLFASHRVVELHRWERAAAGATVRSYEYLGERGEVLRWQGEPDQVERAIGLPDRFDPADAEDPPDGCLVGEQDVMRVAGAWSVDPTSLDDEPAPGPLTMARIPPHLVAPDPMAGRTATVTDITHLFVRAPDGYFDDREPPPEPPSRR
jgi:hypothetical protein